MGCIHRAQVSATVCTGLVQQSSMILHHWPLLLIVVGTRRSLKNSGSHIDASHSRQPLVKGERLVRYEVNAVMLRGGQGVVSYGSLLWSQCVGGLAGEEYITGHGQAHKAGKAEITRGISDNFPSGFCAKILLPQRVCCSRRCAMPVQHLRAPEQAREDTSPEKN